MGGVFRFPGGYRWLYVLMGVGVYISTLKNIRFDAKRQKKRDFMTQEKFWYGLETSRSMIFPKHFCSKKFIL